MPASRVSFPDISARAWQHPRDAAALAAVRQIPGADDLARWMLTHLGGLGKRFHLGGKHQEVSASALPRVDALYREALKTLDAPGRYPLFVVEDDRINAATLVAGEPMLLLTTGAVQALDDQEILTVLGHELGHLLCDHVLYQYLSRLLLSVGMPSGTPLVLPAGAAILLALQSWRRASELSADRASLLVSQDPEGVQRLFSRLGDVRETPEDMRRRAESEQGSRPWRERLRQSWQFVADAHPERHHRVLEIDRWSQGGEYREILAGRYPRRSEDPPTGSDRVESGFQAAGRWLLAQRAAFLGGR